ncbi:MAG: ABC transporter substrate-binding protein [Alphaproteobacteria bacterium]|nr:ABC transporter substrate-binding protein [Alphaproteobacteria bacterium]
MDMRSRFLVFVLPLLACGQATAMGLPSLDASGIAPAVVSAMSSAQTVFVSANDGAAAKSMISRLGDEAIRTISNSGLDEASKKQTFRRLLTQNFDMATIGRFAMGKYWRQATPQQQAEYTRLYEKMIVDVYTARFNKYSGQTFEVTDTRVDESGDIVVSSNVVSSGSTPVSVDWRVRPKGGGYRIIDVMVEGVSMAVTQRNDFAGVIQQGGGTVDALLDYLKKGGTSDVKK